MISFHGDQSIKDKYVFRLSEHHKMDRIIQGITWEEGSGCAVGCTLEKYDHDAYEKELGLPSWLAHLEERIFEGLPKEKAPTFAKEFLEAVPVGVDVMPVKWQLAILRHERDLIRLQDNKEPYADECRNAIQKVIEYCKLELSKTGNIESAARSAWSAAESAAESAARSAARSAWSAAESAAESAARSAARSAWSAAWSVVESAAESARSAAQNHYIWEAETLISLLKGLSSDSND